MMLNEQGREEARAPVLAPLRRLEFRRVEDLATIVPAWAALWQHCPTATPFERPEWALPWAENFCPNTLCALAIYGGNELLGLALWFRYTQKTERRIAFVGGGDSDYHEVLYRPGWAQVVVGSLHEHLIDTRGGWDRCDFEQLPTESPLASHLPAQPLCFERTEGDPCPVLCIDDSTSAVAGVPVHQLARYRKCLRRAERRGRVSLHLSESEAVPQALDDLFRFHTSRWQPRGSAGTTMGPENEAFLRAVAGRFAHSSTLRLYALRFDDRNVAVLYGFISKNTMFCYLQGFDQDLAKYSPGMLIVGSVIHRAAEEGLRTVDFLRGSEPYKFAWGGRSRATSVVRLRVQPSP
jgi:CelD/BcsL family acetyltransferase involved in cellulose biosynthesis